jgi:hypothetical protein
MVEPITAVHFIKGAVSPKTALKSIAFGFWLALFILVGFTIWKAFFAKTESYSQKAENIQNIEIYNPEDSFFIGIKALGLKFGISKPIVKKVQEAIKELPTIQPANTKK